MKNLGKDKDLEAKKVTDPTMMRTLELAIQFGKWVLIEGVTNELDPSLEPILL